MHKLKGLSVHVLLAAVFVALDQYSKFWIQQHFSYREIKPLFAWLNITLIYNQGAAFGIFNQAGGWQQGLLSAVAIIVIVGIGIWLYRQAGNISSLSVGLSCILAGALGNLIDRSVYGHVVDFIDVHINQWHWPTFNAADITIVCGACLIILSELRKKS